MLSSQYKSIKLGPEVCQLHNFDTAFHQIITWASTQIYYYWKDYHVCDVVFRKSCMRCDIYTISLVSPLGNFVMFDICWVVEIGVEKGSKDPKQDKVGMITVDQLRIIAAEKLPDLNCTTIESAMRIIAGTAANMGIDIDPPILEPKKKAVLL